MARTGRRVADIARRRYIAGLIFIAVVVASCSPATVGQNRQPGPISIGAVLSLTGDASGFGLDQQLALNLAVKQINESGGVGGAPLKLTILDDGSVPSNSAQQMTQLIEADHVVAIFGPTLSNEGVVADPVADSLETPVLSISNTATGIVGDCPYDCRWIWRDSLGEDTSVPANIRTSLIRTHFQSAAIINTSPDHFGEGDAAIATRTFNHLGVPVVSTQEVSPQPSGTEVSQAVGKALSASPDVLFVGSSFPSAIGAIIQQVRAQGFQGAVLGGDTFNSASGVADAGPAGAGAQSGASWWSANDFPANSDFKELFQDAYGAKPDSLAAQAYTGVLIIAQALRIANIPGSSASVMQLRSRIQGALGKVAITTPLGPFRFQASHDVSQIVWVVAMNGKGGLDLVDFCNPTC